MDAVIQIAANNSISYSPTATPTTLMLINNIRLYTAEFVRISIRIPVSLRSKMSLSIFLQQ